MKTDLFGEYCYEHHEEMQDHECSLLDTKEGFMTTTDEPVHAGELYETPDRVRIKVLRVSSAHKWADVRVTLPSGATWPKRQPLVDGRFSFEAKRK